MDACQLLLGALELQVAHPANLFRALRCLLLLDTSHMACAINAYHPVQTWFAFKMFSTILLIGNVLN